MMWNEMGPIETTAAIVCITLLCITCAGLATMTWMTVVQMWRDGW